MRLRSAGSSRRTTTISQVLGIHLTQVGSIPCGWAASESLSEIAWSAPLGHGALPPCPAARSTQKRALCSCVALASQWRLLIARPKDPCFFLCQARTTICWGYLSQMDTQFSGFTAESAVSAFMGIDSSSDESAISIPRAAEIAASLVKTELLLSI